MALDKEQGRNKSLLAKDFLAELKLPNISVNNSINMLDNKVAPESSSKFKRQALIDQVYGSSTSV